MMRGHVSESETLMHKDVRIEVDFNTIEVDGACGTVSLTTLGARRSLAQHEITLAEHQSVQLYMPDGDAAGMRDDLVVRATVHRDAVTGRWLASFPVAELRHASASPGGAPVVQVAPEFS